MVNAWLSISQHMTGLIGMMMGIIEVEKLTQASLGGGGLRFSPKKISCGGKPLHVSLGESSISKLSIDDNRRGEEDF